MVGNLRHLCMYIPLKGVTIHKMHIPLIEMAKMKCQNHNFQANCPRKKQWGDLGTAPTLMDNCLDTTAEHRVAGV